MAKYLSITFLLLIFFATDLLAEDDVSKIPDDAEKTSSGLVSNVLQKGTGTQHPRQFSQIVAHYTGWTLDGKKFDSSYDRNKPLSFDLRHVIKGWQEGIRLMVKGEKRRLWIPADMAYGNDPQEGDAPRGMLVFDVELVSFDEGDFPGLRK